MLTLRRVLFPTDYSACAEDAFTHAAYLADRHDAELHVLHVTEADEPLHSAFDDVRITPEDVAADLRLPLRPRGGRPTDAPIALTEVEVPGPYAAPAILRYADDYDTDLIVMGTHGRRGLRHLMIGSVAEEVVRRAPCPVFTVRSRDRHGNDGRDGHTADPWTIQHVLAPVDLSERAALAARHAAELAALYRAELDLVFVIDAITLPAASPFDRSTGLAPDDAREWAQTHLDALATTLRTEVPLLRGRITTHLQVGHPVRTILDLAKSLSTDLLVLGSHGHSGLERFLLGGVAVQLVRMAPCPVFTLKSFGRSLVPEATVDALTVKRVGV